MSGRTLPSVANLTDDGVQQLLRARHHAVLSTFGARGDIHATVVWIDLLDGLPAVNGDAARVWCGNLARNAGVTVVVYDRDNPDTYVEIRGAAQARTEGAVAHDNRLAAKYRGPGTINCARNAHRITWLITPERIRYQAG